MFLETNNSFDKDRSVHHRYRHSAEHAGQLGRRWWHHGGAVAERDGILGAAEQDEVHAGARYAEPAVCEHRAGEGRWDAIALAGHNQSPPVSDSSGCLGLQGLSNGISGSAIAQFKNQAKGLDNTTLLPKLLDSGGNANVRSTSPRHSAARTRPTPGARRTGEFQIGTQFGTTVTPRNGTDAFEGPGTSHGSNDAFDGTTGESEGSILVQCLGKEVKLLNFGIGHVNFG